LIAKLFFLDSIMGGARGEARVAAVCAFALAPWLLVTPRKTFHGDEERSANHTHCQYVIC